MCHIAAFAAICCDDSENNVTYGWEFMLSFRGPDVVYEEQIYLESQSGTARLDKFTHCLLVRCSYEVSYYLLSLLLSVETAWLGLIV